MTPHAFARRALHEAPSARCVRTTTTAPDDAPEANAGVGTAYFSTTSNTAVPNSLSLSVDRDKGVTERHGFGANNLQLLRVIAYLLVSCKHDTQLPGSALDRKSCLHIIRDEPCTAFALRTFARFG